MDPDSGICFNSEFFPRSPFLNPVFRIHLAHWVAHDQFRFEVGLIFREKCPLDLLIVNVDIRQPFTFPFLHNKSVELVIANRCMQIESSIS